MKKSFVNFGHGLSEVAVESIGNDINVKFFNAMDLLTSKS